jgi:hypothetical protein
MVANFEERHMTRDIAFLVRLRRSEHVQESGKGCYLDHKVKMAKIFIAASRGVTTHDFLSIYLCSDLYMLANRETKDVSLAWKSEAISMLLVNTEEMK